VHYAATAPTYETREATSPEPCKWFTAGLGHHRPHAFGRDLEFYAVVCAHGVRML
jgi:hypothetical protein